MGHREANFATRSRGHRNSHIIVSSNIVYDVYIQAARGGRDEIPLIAYTARRSGLTVNATLIGGALVVGALDLRRVRNRDVVAGTRVVRAEGLTALVDFALVSKALHVHRLGYRGEAAGAPDGVAVLRLRRTERTPRRQG